MLHRQRKDSASSVSSEAGSDLSDRPLVDLYVEEGELSDDQDTTVTEPDIYRQIFTDASKEGWGAHLDEHSARGTWSLPESKLHVNEVAGLLMQKNHSDCSGMTQHALVLGSSGHVQPNPTEPAHSAQPFDTALQSGPSQKSNKPKSLCMAAGASAIKEQGFSEAVAARIEAPQRRSTRSVYEAKWTIFTKWCITNKVDFRAPSVKSVADCLLYLFQDRNYNPAPLMVTGQPLLINWEIHPLISARTKISLISWIVSTETDPKAAGESPPGTSPWFCTS